MIPPCNPQSAMHERSRRLNQIITKLTSRKLWAALIGTLAGLAMVFGLDESTMNTACGTVVSAASLVAYIVTEGKIDAEKMKRLLKNAEESEHESR